MARCRLPCSEFGTPTEETFRRGRDGFTHNVPSEPLLTEFSAIYFGANAYQWEEAGYRQWLHNIFADGWLYHGEEHDIQSYKNMSEIQQLYRTRTAECWRTAGLSGGLRWWCWTTYEFKKINYPTLAWIAGQPEAYTARDHHFSSGQKFQKQIILINDTRQPQDFTATWTATVSGQTVGQGELHGSLEVSEIRKLPIEISAPRVEAGGKADGQVTLTATIGEATHQDSFGFRVFGVVQPASGDIATIDPEGLTSKMLKNFGYTTHDWNGSPAPLVVIGRNALKDDPALAAKLEPFVRGGGRVLIFAQDPDWMKKALGWRVCPKVSRYVFSIPHSPVARGIDADDLRDWTGESTLIEAYPKYEGDYLLGNEGGQPYAGWHWGNRGGVSSAAIEKPHRSGWTPLLECEFDLAYAPLMELDYGQGRLIVCTLDLEDHVALDPAARLLAGRVMDYALHAPLAPRASKVVYLGGATGAAWLDKIGVSYERSDTLDTSAGLVLIGPDATRGYGSTQRLLGAGRQGVLPAARPGGRVARYHAETGGSRVCRVAIGARLARS